MRKPWICCIAVVSVVATVALIALAAGVANAQQHVSFAAPFSDGTDVDSVSPDGKRVACWRGKDGRRGVFINGVATSATDSDPQFFWSPDGSQLAYVEHRRKPDGYPQDSLVHLEGRVLGPYAPQSPASLVFSPDGRHFAFAAETPTKQFVVVLDGIERPAGLWASTLTFSADSQHLAYLFRDGPGDGSWHVAIDGTVSTLTLQRPLPAGPGYRFEISLTPDGKRWACAAILEKRPAVVADDKCVGEYTDVVPSSVQFSPDGQQVCYVADDARYRYHLYKNGVPGPAFGYIWSFGWSKDGLHEYMLASPSGDVFRYQTAPVDGRRPWKVGVRGLYLDGKRIAEHARSMVISPDGKHTMCEISSMVDQGDDGMFSYVEVDGLRQPRISSCDSMIFSPDSKHWCYFCTEHNRIANSVVIDGTPITLPQGVYAGMHFESDGSLVGVAMTDKQWRPVRIVP